MISVSFKVERRGKPVQTDNISGQPFGTTAVLFTPLRSIMMGWVSGLVIVSLASVNDHTLILRVHPRPQLLLRRLSRWGSIYA